jgi:polyhydroxybutyrate depolymerase
LAAAVLLLAAVVSGVVWLRGNSGAERAEGAVAGSTHVIGLTYGGVARDYRLFTPGHLAGRSHPLLVAIHQLHGSAAAFERRTRLDAGAEQRGVVVVYPDGIGHSWNAGTCCQPAAAQSVDDVGFVSAVIADVSRRVRIDAHRVAVTGFSNGAMMSYRMVCERADLVHVAIAVAGDLVIPTCTPSRPVSMLHVHGARDGIVAISGVASSPIDAFGFPAATSSVRAIANADGCVGGATSPVRGGSLWRAAGCPQGVRVDYRISRRLGHSYPVGSTVAARVGLDMPTVTWQWLRSLWGI